MQLVVEQKIDDAAASGEPKIAPLAGEAPQNKEDEQR